MISRSNFDSSMLKIASSLSRRDDGGVTFIEVLATFLMVAAAVVGTTYSLFFANRSLDVDMHRQQILRIVQQELEYWVGRIYTGQPGVDPTVEEMLGSPSVPYKKVYLDSVAAPTQELIEVRLFYDPITAIPDLTGNSESGIAYWIVTVWAEWTETDGQTFTRKKGNAVVLTTNVSQAG